MRQTLPEGGVARRYGADRYCAPRLVSVRGLVRTEVGLVATFATGLLVGYIGLAVAVSGRHRFAGVLVLLVGLWLMVSAPVVHDRIHRERGESSHALWGKNDRWKPPWWPGR